MRSLIFHHNDADGYCSAAIVEMYLKGMYCERPKELLIKKYSADYGNDLPLHDIDVNKDKVFVVDFAFKPLETMSILSKQMGHRFVWFDHHQSSWDYVKSQDQDITGAVVVGKAACELCWESLFPGEEKPEVLKRLAAYDIWDKKVFDWRDQLALQYALKAIGLHNFDWESYLGISAEPQSRANRFNMLRQLIQTGRKIEAYDRRRTIKNVHEAGYTAGFGGLEVYALNTQTTGSPQFGVVYQAWDAVLVYAHIKGDFWRCSLYSDKEHVDCQAICKQFGGGGHKGAAGFTCDTETLFKALVPVCGE